MEELLIEDKKYISLKQAAQATGYAKDYVGQLCREGRVQARLIGRNWYVLESALADHRFGEPKKPVRAAERKAEEPGEMWEAPRYEAVPIEPLSVIEETEEVPEAAAEDPKDAKYLQEAWNEWFERFNTAAATVTHLGEEKGEKEKPQPDLADPEPAAEVPVAIRVKAEPLSAPMAPRTPRTVYEPVQEVEPEERVAQGGSTRGKRVFYLSLQVVMLLITLLTAGSAVIGTGYFDEEISSYRQVSQLAGVIYYNK